MVDSGTFFGRVNHSLNNQRRPETASIKTITGEIMENYLTVIKKYAVFEGRARRKEFWMFQLINFLIYTVLAILTAFIRVPIIELIYALAIMCPAIAVSVRRLHDTGRSGWWFLIGLIPLVGLILIYFDVLDGTPGPNEFGPNPKA
jgi:uncharacterized membrane protein YhaH (DUF805 family)